MIKYLYLLVSDDSDYYLEQALMSITSLKMYAPNAFVSLLIDDITEKALTDKRRNILELIDELKIIKIERQFNKKARSRWLKTSMRHLIEGNFLYIDCDTVICEDLRHIENVDVDLGAVLDRHVLLDDHCRKRYIQNSDKLLGFNSSLTTNKHFNSGIVFCRDVSKCHNFFNEWHKLWLTGITKRTIDQPSFNQANLNCNDLIKEMDGIWNCQIGGGGLPFLFNAKIVHYFVTEYNIPYKMADAFFLEKVKHLGVIDNEIKKMLENPRVQFDLNTRIISNEKILKIIDSSLFSILRRTYDCKFVKLLDEFLVKLRDNKIN